MANLKQYAYFLKGNKLAIVENDITPENDPTSRDYGPDARSIRYKSPTEDVSSGLEIEYAYSPKYRLSDDYAGGMLETSTWYNKFIVQGWINKSGYLAFVRTDSDNTGGDASGGDDTDGMTIILGIVLFILVLFGGGIGIMLLKD